MAKDVPGVSFHDLSAGGRVGELIRDKDWSATPLGPRDAWPRSLNNHLSMIFELPTAAIIFWGPDQIQLYNDGYSVIMGPRHPQHLGSTFRECWPEAYPTIHPWMQRVLERGETVEVNRTLVPLTRFGFTEEAYFTFSFSPLRDDEGRIAGILQIVTEVTGAVLGERRADALRELSNQTAHAKTMHDAPRLAADVLGKYAADLPFCLIYVVDDDRLVLSGCTGLPSDHPFPASIDDAAIPELTRVVRDRKDVPIENLVTRFGTLPAGAWPEAPALALASPIYAADQRRVVAVLVSGISPRLALDGPYRGFLQLICAQLATLMAAARAYDDERKRAEALAEIDRAKTEFFSNVSHEFRTPLTLILGPLEDALRDPAKMLRRDVLEAVHRNALRLLKLVNTLLDFSRLEANRLVPSFEPTDLPALTAALAHSFESLVETAGLKLRVDCPAMTEPVYVDRAQWEKIVLNLVSNAFKFTFEGEIAVRLHERDELIHLSVSDTGTGIPAEELPKIFDRFHRVKSARARSFEGTGIGLALVQELAEQHGGVVRVESVVGKGTTFDVSIPKRTGPPREDANRATPDATPYVLEAANWNKPVAPVAERPVESRARVLVVDDNADMREHLVRLLSPTWSVEAAEDGQAALEAVLRQPPDLVLSDVMMPRMDGVALVRALRANPTTSTLPVVLLSARVGEEAVVGGFETGADDYLVKPFSSHELLARVRAHLTMGRLRREALVAAEKQNAELETKNREIEWATRQKSEFLANMSHELRTPLTAIIGFAELLHDGVLTTDDPEYREFVGDILTSSHHLLQLINDILDLSKIEAGKLVLAPQPVDLRELIGEVTAVLRAKAASKQIAVETRVAQDIGRVMVDPARLKQVLYNYVANALKFTPEGGRVEVSATPAGANAFRIAVDDNGIGIAPRDLERLFVEYQQLEVGPQHKEIGTGLGLAVSKRLVEAHGGSVGARSTVGRGSTFYATLPRRVPHVAGFPSPQTFDGATANSPRVLIVEDRPDDRAVLVETLSAAGFALEVVATGAQALDASEARRFDAVTLDLRLPDADGLDLLRAIRQTQKNHDVPAIAVTAFGDQIPIRAFRIHDVIRKPFEAGALVASLERAGVTASASDDPNVLVVDDDAGARDFMRMTLGELGYRVTTAEDGAAGLERVQHERLAAVILDLMMPRMDGFEFLARLREMPGRRDLPVIVSTAKSLTPKEQDRLRGAGAAVMAKEDASFILEELRTALSQQRHQSND